MSALSGGNSVMFLEMIEGVDERESIGMPDGSTAVVTRAGVYVVRTIDPSTLDGHAHPSVEEAQTCYAANVEQARAIAANDPRELLRATLSQIKGLAGGAGPTGMYL